MSGGADDPEKPAEQQAGRDADEAVGNAPERLGDEKRLRFPRRWVSVMPRGGRGCIVIRTLAMCSSCVADMSVSWLPWPSSTMAHVDSETRAADSRNDVATRPSSVLNSPSTRTGRVVDANPRDVKAQLMPSVHFAREVYPDMVMLCAARGHGMPEVFGRNYTWGETKRFKGQKDVRRSPIGQWNLIEAMSVK